MSDDKARRFALNQVRYATEELMELAFAKPVGSATETLEGRRWLDYGYKFAAIAAALYDPDTDQATQLLRESLQAGVGRRGPGDPGGGPG